MKKCSKCKILKTYSQFYKKTAEKDGLTSSCMSCIKVYNKQYRKKNKQKLVTAAREWRKNNPEKYKQWRSLNHQKKMENPLYRLEIALRRHLKKSIKQKNWRKDNSYKEYVGCSLDNLKKHLEDQFTKDMTWENYGKWHIDHIIPMSSAKIKHDLYKLCHYTNLQPLWAIDNLKKGTS